MKNEGKVLKVLCAIVWTLIAVLGVIFCVEYANNNKPIKESVPLPPEPAPIVEVVEEPKVDPILLKAISICQDDLATEIGHAVYKASKKYSKPAYLIFAYIATESGKAGINEIDETNFMNVNPHAKSSYNCRGLMQLSEYAKDDYNKANGTSYTMDDLYDIEINIEIGTWYISQFDSVSTNYVEQYVIYNVGYGRYSKVNPNWFFGWDGKWYNNYHNSFFFMNDMYPPTESWAKGLYGKNKLEEYKPKQRFEKCLKLCYEHFYN